MSIKSNSSDQRIRELIDVYFSQASAGGQSMEDFAASFPDIETQLLQELKRAAMLFGVQHKVDHSTASDALSSEMLRVTCPECKNKTPIDPEARWEQLSCQTCQSPFSLLQPEQAAYPKVLGNFELQQKLGLGAFGTVWKAYDNQLDRYVAIKLPRRDSLNESQSQQFLEEAKSAARLNHPNIVKVFEVGIVDDVFFIASELIDGNNLAETLATTSFSIADAAAIVKTIASAVNHAHECGIVHRDLKPGNILIDQQGKPFVADFGLAKRDVGEVTVTQTGVIVGTPAYMSPEQAQGQKTTDSRSDIYSLGVILFRLLTGELPFRGTATAILRQAVNEDPPKLRQLNIRIPKDLETICLRCLEKEPGNRFQSAHELETELGRYLEGLPILSRPVSRSTKFVRWCRRRPKLASAIATAILIFVVGTTVSTFLSIKANRASDRATKAMQLADRRIYAADMARVQQAIARGNKMAALELLRKYLPSESATDQRQIEWHYWWRICNVGLLHEYVTGSRVFSIAASPQSDKIAWGLESGKICISDDELNNVVELPIHLTQRINCVRFDKTGDGLAIASQDGTLLIFDLQKNTSEILKRPEAGVSIISTEFLNNGRWLLIGSKRKNKSSVGSVFELFEVASKKVIDEIAIPGTDPWSAISPNDDCFAFGATQGTTSSIMLRCTEDNSTKWQKELAGGGKATFSPDGSKMVAVRNNPPSRQSDFVFLDSGDGEIIKTFDQRSGTSGIGDIAFSHDGKQLIVATGEGSIDIYDLQTMELVGNLSGHRNRIGEIEIAGKHRRMYSASDDGSVRAWTLSLNDTPLQIEVGPKAKELALSNDGRFLGVAVENQLRQWDIETSKWISKLPVSGPIRDLIYEPGFQSTSVCPVHKGEWCGGEKTSA